MSPKANPHGAVVVQRKPGKVQRPPFLEWTQRFSCRDAAKHRCSEGSLICLCHVKQSVGRVGSLKQLPPREAADLGFCGNAQERVQAVEKRVRLERSRFLAV